MGIDYDEGTVRCDVCGEPMGDPDTERDPAFEIIPATTIPINSEQIGVIHHRRYTRYVVHRECLPNVPMTGKVPLDDMGGYLLDDVERKLETAISSLVAFRDAVAHARYGAS